MVKMIEVSRAYEANSKVIQSHDGLLDKAINSVGVTRR
jgi:flagellar basal-body rod protein FlgG